MALQIADRNADSTFLRSIEADSASSPTGCFQCGKCAAGCPIGKYFDYTPAQIMHLIRLEQEMAVLGSKTIWLCASCETCSTRCPQGVDVARIMDAARGFAFATKHKSSVRPVLSFYKATRANLSKFGRMFEVWLMVSLKFRTLDFFKDMDLGMKMMQKGKLAMRPSRARARETRDIIRKANALDAARYKK